jgi:hypothetical protein
MRRPGRLSFLLALSPGRRLEDALKTLVDDLKTELDTQMLRLNRNSENTKKGNPLVKMSAN